MELEVKKKKAMQDVGRIYGIPELHEMRLADFSDIDKWILELVLKVPQVPAPCCYFLALLNVFFPGVGTIISSIYAAPCSKSQFAIGIC